jgi:hypothetical protein
MLPRHLSPLVLLAAVMLAAGCDEGPVGPQGPPGPPGPSETAVYTENFRFDLSDAERSEDGFTTAVPYELDLPPSIADDGAVFLYYRAYGTWTAAPTTVGVEAPNDPPRVDYTVTLGYGYDVDFLEVYLEASSADQAVWDAIAETQGLFTEAGIGDPDGVRMKAVLLEDLAAAAKRSVDFSDYEEVARVYDLE